MVGQAVLNFGRRRRLGRRDPKDRPACRFYRRIDVRKDGNAGRSLVGVVVEKGEAVGDRPFLPDGLVLYGQVEAVRELDQAGRVVKDRIDVGRRVAGEQPVVLDLWFELVTMAERQRDRPRAPRGENDGFLIGPPSK